MKVLFLTIGGFSGINDHGIYTDLLREFARHGHEVYVVCSEEKRSGKKTWLATEEVSHAENTGVADRSIGIVSKEIPPAKVLHVRIGNITKTSIIEKGISTVAIGRQYKAAIKRHFVDVRFDLIMYSTPPITLAGVVESLKKKYNARTYLLLKDIFPQNAVDIGMMSKTGLKAPLYRHFRKQEKKLYAVSDRIGCMSHANVRYVLEHNQDVLQRHLAAGGSVHEHVNAESKKDSVSRGIVEVCSNSIEPQDMSLPDEERMQLRRLYDIPEDKTVFIYGGNLGKPQGIDFMLRCLHTQRKNKDAFFLIVGSGTEFDRIQRYIEKYKPDNIVLKESLPKEDYDRIVAACDVGMIFLDHRFTIPNFPSRLLSYMQAKVPVLAVTDPNTDMGEIITGRSSGIDMESVSDYPPFGWWAESDDVRTASEMIKQISHMDTQELFAMGDNGYDYMIANYDVRDAYETIMKE